MKKVLVADDKDAGRELVRTVLENCNYEVYEAANGVEALDQARAVLPDLIILDLHMPGLDGFGVVQELRRDPRFAKTPVMALTASAMMGDREMALAAGFSGYIAKPIRLSTLRAEVERMLAFKEPASTTEPGAARPGEVRGPREGGAGPVPA